MVFNSEYIENENRHLSEEVVEKYEIRKYKDLKNQKEFYISHLLENLNEVLTEPCFNGIVLTLVDVVNDAADNLYEVNPNPVIESFKADFNQLKLNSVDFIRAYASVYSYLYKNNSEFYTPLAYICQCSGSGKSKSATTVLKETPGFYVCLRNPDRDKALLLVPKANLITNALQDIFYGTYINDGLEDQSKFSCNSSTVGKCLMFVAQSIKSYIIEVGKNLAMKLDGKEDEATLELKLISTIKEFSSNNFEASNTNFELFSSDSMMNDFLLNAGEMTSGVAKVSHVIKYIKKILDDAVNCFKFGNVSEKDLLENDSRIAIACKAISSKINDDSPFIFFIDEAGLLSKEGKFAIKGFQDNEPTFSALQLFRRALAYLDLKTNIFFFALGTKSTIEELSPPIIDNSLRGQQRKNFFPPIIVTQNFDIWREKYPLNEMVPCYKTLLNCCTFKFLATLGHPLFSSLYFDDIVKLAVKKLYNGSKNTDKTYLLATWMIRGGLACDPKSVLAESLVENHMATLFNIKPDEISSTRKYSNTMPIFGNVGSASYDITYQSNPCLALAARDASLNLENNVEYFKQLNSKIESMVVDRGKLGEATGGLLTALLIDVIPNSAEKKLTPELIEQMKSLTPEKFHSLWEAKGSILCPDSGDLKTDFIKYKVGTVESFLMKLMGDDEFERVKHTFPSSTLKGLVNVSHFVSTSRIGEPLENANDLVADKFRNVITMDRLRLALARQCGLIMPPNYYGIDAIIPVCLAREEVIDPDGNVTIKDADRMDRADDIPYALYDSRKHCGKNRYRPIYSFIAIQYKSGRFDLDAIPKMQARLHIVPCANYDVKDGRGIHDHLKCSNCLSELGMKEIFDNQISLLYCFLSKDDSTIILRNQFFVNNGPEYQNQNSSTDKSFESKEYFLKKLYPDIDGRELKTFEKSAAKLVESNAIRTFEDFFLRHRIKVNNSIEVINGYSDDHQGCTYRASDLKKWENHEKHLELESKRQKRSLDSDDKTSDSKAAIVNAAVAKFEALSVSSIPASTVRDSVTRSISDSAAGSVSDTGNKSSAVSSINEIKIPDPVRLSFPFEKSRMSTVVIYGWKPWEKVIGKEGTVLAENLFSEFVQDPLKNVEQNELNLLIPSLKIIMSSKFLGLDRYLERQDGQDDISYNHWIYYLFEKFNNICSTKQNKLYLSAQNALNKKISTNPSGSNMQE
jgi:hypothetical protein